MTAISTTSPLLRFSSTGFGLSVVGSAGVLLLGKHNALIPLVRPLLIELRNAGLDLDDATYS